MVQIDNPNKKIKIESALFEEFSSPISENPNTYMRVDENGIVQYLNPGLAGVDIGSALGSTIGPWNNYTQYYYGQLVTYDNQIFSCNNENYVPTEEFQDDDWDIIAGYQKESLFYQDDENPITSIVLEEEVADKDFLQINVDGVLLQTNQYELEDDDLTVTFYEPIPAGSSINVIVVGNYSRVENANKIVTKTFTTTQGQTEFDMVYELTSRELVYVVVENAFLLQSEWEIGEDRHTIIFKNPCEEGERVQISAWTNVGLEVGVTFTPHTERKDVEDITKERTYTELSWTNDGGLDNPESVNIYDGVIYTPHTEKTEYDATITWTNNGGLENPEPISIFTNYTRRVVETFVAKEGQTEFKASMEISSKAVLSVNVSNSELLSDAYELKEDKQTVEIIGDIAEGEIVELKYFINVYIVDNGFTFTPHIEETENQYILSWTNDGGLENPETIYIDKVIHNESIKVGGVWSEDKSYEKYTIVTYTDNKYEYGYISNLNVPMNTPLTNTVYWTQLYKVYTEGTIEDMVTKQVEEKTSMVMINRVWSDD